MLTLLDYSMNQSFLPEHYFSYIMWALKVRNGAKQIVKTQPICYNKQIIKIQHQSDGMINKLHTGG